MIGRMKLFAGGALLLGAILGVAAADEPVKKA